MHASKLALDIFKKTQSSRHDKYGIVANITSSTRNQVTKNIHISEWH